MLTLTDLTLDRVQQPDLLLFDAVSGSHAYGTNTAESDLDRRGIFRVPDAFHAGLDHIEQVNDPKCDITFYELRRFFSLLLKNNPTVMELLFTPDDCVLFRHPALERIDPHVFLSKLCQATFCGYATQQIKKARGLNKKIVNPEPEERHHLRHFCHVLAGQGSVPLMDWLIAHGVREEECGLVSIPHMPNTYGIFHRSAHSYRGIFSPKDDAAVVCSSIPKGEEAIAWMHCNVDAFKRHCRLHQEYWTWVRERNEARYRTNTEHGRGYDSKNMMHTLRLLDMAYEIATEITLQVRRPNAAWLLRVRAGEFKYEELLEMAEAKSAEVEAAFQNCRLPDTPDRAEVARLLREVQITSESNTLSQSLNK